MIEYPVLVLHNVVSSSSCIEFVKISAGMGFKTVAITQAQGSAAQRGLPAAQKIAMQNNINFFSLNNLDDIKELLKPDLIILSHKNKMSHVFLFLRNQMILLMF
jgi:SpoU rRNA methylase family enzyme